MLVIRHRTLVLALSLILLGLSGWSIATKPIYFDNSNEMYFLMNDPNLLAVNKLTDLFGDSEYLSIGISARPTDQDVFEPQTIQMIHDLTEFLEDHPIVTQVRSLSKYQYTHDDEGRLATDYLFDDPNALPENPGLLQDARNIMRLEKLALDTLISQDFQNTRIMARTEYRKAANDHKVQVVTDVIQFIEAEGYKNKGYQIHLSGVPVISERFETLTKSDSGWINPTIVIVMTLILFLTFRSITGTLLPWVLIGITILGVTAIQAQLGWPYTAVNTALVPTLIIIGVGAAVHVLVEFYHFRNQGQDSRQAATETITNLLQPVFFTSLTTSLGFSALAVTDLLPVKQYAYLAALGPMIIFLVAMTTLPAILSFVPWLTKKTKNAFAGDWVSRITSSIPDFSFQYRRVITALGFAALVFSIVMMPRITVDSNFINYFKEKSWVTQDLLYFDQHFNGIAGLEIIVDSGTTGGIKEPRFLHRANKLQDYLKSLEQTGEVASLLDFLKQIRQAVSNDDPKHFTLPDSVEMTAQLLLLYENSGPDEDLSDLKDFDERYIRITVPTINMDASKMTALLATINDTIDKDFPDLAVEITGPIVMLNSQDRYINEGLFRSFTIALGVIGLSFFFLFRSVKYGFIALVPSVVPILITGGIVSLLGISLDLGTMVVGAMTMGIAVDDAIHVVSRYLLGRSQQLSVRDSIRRAMTESGRAVVFTSVVLVIGFSVMLLGSFIPYIQTGLFSATIMALALLGDLIVLPALLYLVDGRNEATGNRSSLQPS